MPDALTSIVRTLPFTIVASRSARRPPNSTIVIPSAMVGKTTAAKDSLKAAGMPGRLILPRARG